MEGVPQQAASLLRFWTMLAHDIHQIWNASVVAGSLGISDPTCLLTGLALLSPGGKFFRRRSPLPRGFSLKTALQVKQPYRSVGWWAHDAGALGGSPFLLRQRSNCTHVQEGFHFESSPRSALCLP